MERIAINIPGYFPVTERGNRYFIVATDYCRKWPEASTIPNEEVSSIAEVLADQLVCQWNFTQTKLESLSQQWSRWWMSCWESKNVAVSTFVSRLESRKRGRPRSILDGMEWWKDITGF